MKDSLRIKKYINPEIKVGSKVRLVDGSAFTSVSTEKAICIIFPLPELTGSHKRLDEIEAIVTEVDVTDRIKLSSIGNAYLQDITVKIGSGLFRTCSGFVQKLRTPEEVIQDRLKALKDVKDNLIKSDEYASVIGKAEDDYELLHSVLNEIKNSKIK